VQARIVQLRITARTGAASGVRWAGPLAVLRHAALVGQDDRVRELPLAWVCVSEPTPVSTGIRGQKGGRKAPSFVNQAVTLSAAFFWDGRARSLEDQALGPIANPIEMGNTHAGMEQPVSRQRIRAVFQGSVRLRADHQRAGCAGDCRLRAHAHERQLAVWPMAFQAWTERRACRRRGFLS